MRRLSLLLAAAALAACAHRDQIPNTTVLDTQVNREILRTIEEYRTRLLEHNIDGLLVLASQTYFEDSGTPRADDDYGYDGLRQVLTSRLQRLRSLRYDIQYRNVTIKDGVAEVEVFLNGSFELASETGERYRRVNDYHRFKLERNAKDKWKFQSGM